MKLHLSLLLWSICLISVHAQADLLEYRPKIIEIGQRDFSSYNSVFDENGERNRFTRDRLLTLRLGVPVVLKSKTLFGVQLKYYRQTYQLEEDALHGESIYRYLNNEALINTGINLLFQRTIDDRRKLTFIGLAELASDSRFINKFTARYFISGAYNIRKHNGLEIGYGLVVNYALGVLNIYPTFTYKKAINPKLMFEGVFPSSLSLRYHPSNKDHFITSLNFNNWRFNVTDALTQQPDQLTLQRADFTLNFTYEKMVHDWLWVGGEVSYVYNLAFLVSLPGKRITEPLQNYELNNATYFKISLFIVPPRRLWDGLDQ